MRFIFTSANVVAIILIAMIFYGCGSAEKTVLVKSRAGLSASDYDERYKLDSFKVVKVIDERASQDEFIGIADRRGANLMLQEPLSDYLLPRFNLAIARDTSVKKYTPVTVRVRDFYFGRFGSLFNRGAFFRFDLSLEYPKEGQLKKFVLVDSIPQSSTAFMGDVMTGDPGESIQIGLLEASRLFVLNEQGKISVANNKNVNWDSSSPKLQLFDSVNWSYTKRYIVRIGLNYGHRFGIKSSLNSSVELYKTLQYAGGFLFGNSMIANYGEVKRDSGLGTFYSYGAGIIIGHSFTPGYNWKGYRFTICPYVGSETFANRAKLVYGGRLEGAVCVDLMEYFTIELGAYLQGHIGGRILPYDAGLTLAAGMNTGY